MNHPCFNFWRLRELVCQPSPRNERGAAGLVATPRRVLLVALQVLDSGRNNLGLVLPAIVSAVAVMQVAIDPDKPAFGAFLDYFLGQFPEGDHGMPSFCKQVGYLPNGNYAKHACCAVVTGGKDALTVRGEHGTGNGGGVALEDCQQVTAVRIPHLGFVATGGEDALTIRREHRAVALESGQQLAAGSVPHPRGAVCSVGDNSLAVWGERRAVNKTGMVLESGQQLTADGVPHLHRGVSVGGEDALAVGGEHRTVKRIGVPF